MVFVLLTYLWFGSLCVYVYPYASVYLCVSRCVSGCVLVCVCVRACGPGFSPIRLQYIWEVVWQALLWSGQDWPHIIQLFFLSEGLTAQITHPASTLNPTTVTHHTPCLNSQPNYSHTSHNLPQLSTQLQSHITHPASTLNPATLNQALLLSSPIGLNCAKHNTQTKYLIS
jgi:hypothetical protein